ncbi:MAG: hypothetical protein LC635_04960, partial [Pseudonocardiaceae bacterium]|nr:hypothetical protein [Pseudonocardiaceae bacterium]
MDAPVSKPGAAAAAAAAPAARPTAAAPYGNAAPARAAAPPLRVAAPGRAAATGQLAAAARPMPQLLSEADLRTRPLLVAPLVRPVRPVPVAPAATPPKQTWAWQVRSYVERLNPLQVICWQVAAISVLLTVRQPWPVLVAASAGAAALLVLTTVRIGGR